MYSIYFNSYMMKKNASKQFSWTKKSTNTITNLVKKSVMWHVRSGKSLKSNMRASAYHKNWSGERITTKVCRFLPVLPEKVVNAPYKSAFIIFIYVKLRPDKFMDTCTSISIKPLWLISNSGCIYSVQWARPAEFAEWADEVCSFVYGFVCMKVFSIVYISISRSFFANKTILLRNFV